VTVTLSAQPRPHPLGDWVYVVLAGVLLSAGLAAAVWVADHLHADETLHEVALFAHLASLVLGFGSVLAIDSVALQWALRRRQLTDVLDVAGHVQVPIWVGLAGLVVSGMVLEPDIDATLTQTKLALVLTVTWNGLIAAVLHRRLKSREGQPGRLLLLVSAMSAGVSQAGWWGAMVIGFVNH
jgi:hypothetical protein